MFFLSWEFLSCVNNMSLIDPVVVSTAIVFTTIQLFLISLIRTELMYPPIPQPWRQPGMGVIVLCSLWMFNWMLINAAASYLILWRPFSDSHNVLIYRLGHGPGWCGNHSKVERDSR